jgi:hypothetical protein
MEVGFSGLAAITRANIFHEIQVDAGKFDQARGKKSSGDLYSCPADSGITDGLAQTD